MKVARTFTIEQEIAELLKKEANQSDLINRLLKQHFSSGKLSKEVLESSMSNKRIEINKLKLEMEELTKQHIELTRPRTLMERIH